MTKYLKIINVMCNFKDKYANQNMKQFYFWRKKNYI